MRGSLRDLTLQRLGRIDEALVTPNFFRAALAGELAEEAAFKKSFAAAEPAILISGNLQAGNGEDGTAGDVDFGDWMRRWILVAGAGRAGDCAWQG